MRFFKIGKKPDERSCRICGNRYNDTPYMWPIVGQDICLTCYRLGAIWAAERAAAEGFSEGDEDETRTIPTG